VLVGRGGECRELDTLLDAVRQGTSRALVVCGDAGVGKSSLLDYLERQAAGCRVRRAAGVQSEMELPFAGLHQLCASLLDRVDELPRPQRVALKTAFGIDDGPPPDRLLVGLAVLGLLADQTDGRPLVCVVDDVQWLDQASAQALAFVARRIARESIALVFALRDSDRRPVDLEGIPELTVEPLSSSDSRAVLRGVLQAPLDHRVRDQIVQEARGNPFALLEFAHGLSPHRLAGGFGLPGAASAPRPVEASLLGRLEALPAQTRKLLLIAAAEPAGDTGLLWRAAERFDIPPEAADPAARAKLAEFEGTVRFSHPIVRSVVYRAASPQDRRATHRTLAEVSDPAADADRRAWHLAHGAVALDDEVAAELERSASRAQGRGGLAAAAAFLERSADLTVAPAQRCDRALKAAHVKHQAGDPEGALALLAVIREGPPDELRAARAQLLAGEIAAAGSHDQAPRLLHQAATMLQPLDARLARDAYLYALAAGTYLCRRGDGSQLRSIGQAARALPRALSPSPPDLLVDALAVLVTDGFVAAAGAMKQAARAFLSNDVPAETRVRWGWLAGMLGADAYDYATVQALCERHIRHARETGALALLPFALSTLAESQMEAGDFRTARMTHAEAMAVIEAATGRNEIISPAFALAAFTGSDAEFYSLVGRNHELAASLTGRAPGITQWAIAVFELGLGRYEEALTAARNARAGPIDTGPAVWVLPELIEAAMRCGAADAAREALEALVAVARATDTDFFHGVTARSRALISADRPELGYREALELLTRASNRIEVARTHLLYGEWLRRQRRRREARDQLGIACDMFTSMGMIRFAERARRELVSTGATVRRRSPETLDDLTAREAQIARLAADGLSNPEIATRLFVSPRTAEYHLAKVFTKLGIGSRVELRSALTAQGDLAASHT
jgi:DNA-binding CsgD family transcriptional regulator